MVDVDMNHKDTISLIKALKDAGAKSATLTADGALTVEFYAPPTPPVMVNPWYPRMGPMWTDTPMAPGWINIPGTFDRAPFDPIPWFTCKGDVDGSTWTTKTECGGMGALNADAPVRSVGSP